MLANTISPFLGLSYNDIRGRSPDKYKCPECDNALIGAKISMGTGQRMIHHTYCPVCAKEHKIHHTKAHTLKMLNNISGKYRNELEALGNVHAHGMGPSVVTYLDSYIHKLNDGAPPKMINYTNS